MTDTTSAGSRNCKWGGGGGGHPDPEIREVPGLERIFSPLQASVWSKNKKGPSLGSTTDNTSHSFYRKDASWPFITLLVVRINVKM